MSYSIHWENKGVYVLFNDAFSLQTNELATNEIYGDERIDDVKYIIWDLLNVKNYSMTEHEVKKPAAIDKGASYYLKAIKMLMAAKDDYGQKLCHEYIRMGQHLNIDWDFHLFDSMDKVRNYLLKVGLAE